MPVTLEFDSDCTFRFSTDDSKSWLAISMKVELMARKFPSIVFLLLTYAALPANVLSAQDTVAAVSGSDKVSAEMGLAGLIAGRSKIKSGEFRGVEWYSVSQESPDESLATNELFCAFDLDKDQFRFERNGSRSQLDGNTDESSDIKFQSKYIRISDKSGQWLAINGLGAGKQLDHLSTIKPFHCDVIGVCTTGDLNGFPKLSKLARIYRDQKNCTSRMEEDGRQLIVWRFGQKEEYERRLWLDPIRDYVPTRMEVWTVTRKSGTESLALLVTITTEWRRINDVWVPVKCVHLGNLYNSDVKSYELKISWVRVNEVIPGEVFADPTVRLYKLRPAIDER